MAGLLAALARTSWSSCRAPLGALCHQGFAESGYASILSSSTTIASAWRHMATKKAQELRAGDIIQRDGRLLRVTKFMWEHGRARAQGFILLDLFDVRGGGGKSGIKLKLNEDVTLADLQAVSAQVLYVEGKTVHLMDPETFDQFTAPVEVFGTAGRWLIPEVIVGLKMLDTEPVTGTLPPKVAVKVLEAEAAVPKDDGSTSRSVVVEGDNHIVCPGHIAAGNTVWVSTDSGLYSSKKS